MAHKKNLPDVRRESSTNMWPLAGMQNPFREFSRLQRTVDRLFDDFLNPFYGTTGVSEGMVFSPAVDIEDTDTHYMLSFDLPGISKDDVKIEVRDNQLIVSGVRKEEKATRLSSERFYGTFQRMFMLPASVDADKVEAAYQDGVLRVAIPKVESAKGKVIEVKEGKGGVFSRLLGQDKESKSEKAA